MASGSVRKRGKTWSYIFDLGNIEGKRKQKEKGGFRTKKDAEIALRKALDEFDKGVIVGENRMSLDDLLKYWMENYVRVNLKFRTIERYETDIKNHIRPELGHYYLQKFQPTVIQKFFTQKVQQGLSKNMVNGLYGILSSSLTHALKWGFIKFNPLSMVTLPKQEGSKDVVALTPDQLVKIVKRIKGGNMYLAFIIALNTGLRVGEVCGLEWSDINFEFKSMQITKILQKQNGAWVFTTPKTKSSTRNILMNDTLIQELKKHQIQQGLNRWKYKEHYTENNFVCTKENGESVTIDSLKYLSRVVNHKLGIKFKFHYLRHTHATMLLENGIHPKIVQERLGHSKVSTTLDTYSHVSMNMQQQAIDIFDKAIKGHLPT